MQRHINTDDYPAIASMLRAGYTQADIAKTSGFSEGAISKEIDRNKDEDGIYRACSAQKKAFERRRNSKQKYRKIDNDTDLIKKIENRLEPLVSPEVVAHELGIHHQTIYSWIYERRTDLLDRLPQRNHKRRRYGSKRAKKQGWTQSIKSIHDKPDSLICWEGDTIKGGTRSRVLTHVEQKSLYTRADLIPSGEADHVHAVLKKKPISNDIIYDRGSEFALWKMIERDTGAIICFADPYAPWQRPKNENTNGRLRRVYPKKFNFDTITQKQLDKVIHKMNHTPRKSLDWRTPADVFRELSLHSG